MFTKQRVFVAAVSISAGLLGVSAASAESQKCYTLASLQGNYAIVGNYGANVAIALNEVGEQHKRSFQPLNGERKLFHSFRHPLCTSQQSLRPHRTIRTGR